MSPELELTNPSPSATANDAHFEIRPKKWSDKRRSHSKEKSSTVKSSLSRGMTTTTNLKQNDDYEVDHEDVEERAPEEAHLPYVNSAAAMPCSSSTYFTTSPVTNNLANSYLQGRHSSNEDFTVDCYHNHHPSSHQQKGVTSPSSSAESSEFYSKNLWIASTLVVTYLIEVAIQIFLVIQCCRSFQELQPQDSSLIREVASNTTSAASLSQSSWSWSLIFSSVLSSLLVTFISLVWVFRGMDFSGRICGRLLCYVMHSFLLGLLWRYLKLAFAYDRADLEEFFRLKTIQTYVQSLPLVTIHLAWVLTAQLQLLFPLYTSPYPVDSYHALSSWLVVVEMLCCVTSLLLLSSTVSFTSSSNISLGKRNNYNNNNLHTIVVVATSPAGKNTKLGLESGFSDINPNLHFNISGTDFNVDNQPQRENDENDNTDSKSSSFSPFLVLVKKWMMNHYHYNASRNCYSEPGRAFLLLSRLVSLGMLTYKMNYYWTGFITLLHLTVSFAWLSSWVLIGGRSCVRKNKSTGSPSRARTTAASANDTSRDSSSSKSSSNDSGLVKSEVVMENGMPVVPGEEDEDNDNHNNECECGNNAESIGNGGHAQLEKCNQSSDSDPVGTSTVLNPLSRCFAVSNHQGYEKKKDDNAKIINVLRVHRQQLLMRVLPLTYVLFWDISSSPPAITVFNALGISNILAAILPVLLVIVENVGITLFFLLSYSGEKNILILCGTSGVCLLVGWLLVVSSWHFQWRRGQSTSQDTLRKTPEKSESNCKQVQVELGEGGLVHMEDDVDGDSGYGKRRLASDDDESSNPAKNGKSHSGNRKETTECLSMCCSSLSHPLNIKRKGHQQEDGDNQKEPQENNFGKSGDDKKLSFVELQQNDSLSVTMKKYGVPEQQQDSGKLMNSKNPHRHHHSENYNFSHNSTTSRGKEVTKNSIVFQQQHHHHHSSDHTGVQEVGSEKDCSKSDMKISGRYKGETMINVKKEPRYHENVTMACAKPTTWSSPPPVTNNNYTNIKEALTRRISNKSGSSASLKKNNNRSKTRQHHHSHLQNNQCMNQEKDGESVKGECDQEDCCGGVNKTEGEPSLMMISSFKSAVASPPRGSVASPQQQPTTNSNKCMPISIKSPISWIPETCCNDSSGSGSSNSRNTNTLVINSKNGSGGGANITSSRLFYCPENYIDLDNEEESQLKRTAKEKGCDFSIVFFEDHDRDRGTSRSYKKQKQSRTPLAASGIMERAARSANTTPVASSKHFLPSVVPKREQIQQHPYFHPHHHKHQQCEYDHDRNPIEEEGEFEEGTSTIHNVHHPSHHHQHPRDRLRNQITGKTYLSDGASLTSLDGLCEIRASTPVEIKKASRVIVNYPPPHHQISDSKTVSRCLCTSGVNKVDPGSSPFRSNGKCPVIPHLSEGNNASDNNNIYEKLIDDSYGILICEGGEDHNGCSSRSGSGTGGSPRCNIEKGSSVTKNNVQNAQHCDRRAAGIVPGGSQKLKILCAKCLENHDPLLTNCGNHYLLDEQFNNLALRNKKLEKSEHLKLVSDSPFLHTADESDSTDYPSDTEFTTNNPIEDDGQSLSTHFSSVTYSAWHQQNQHQPRHRQPQPTQLSQFIWAASSMLPTNTSSNGGNNEHCPKEFTSLEYVRTWLMASHPRTFAFNNISHQPNGGGGGSTNRSTHLHPPPPPPQPQHHHQHSHQENQQSDKNTNLRRQHNNNGVGNNRHSSASAHLPPLHHYHQHPGKNDKGLQSASNNNGFPFNNKSFSCDKVISKKKKFRQLEKRQRPIGRGASPPTKELCSVVEKHQSQQNSTNNNFQVNNINAVATCDAQAGKPATSSARYQPPPPPSRKQHPLLFYDDNNKMAQQEEQQQKPLLTATTTTHKKCRDQLDLFHKELETVV